jgi:Autotransporter beta-domain
MFTKKTFIEKRFFNCKVVTDLYKKASYALSVFFLMCTTAFADCSTVAGVVTCTGSPDGINGAGSWALGIPPVSKTFINNGTLNPDASVTGIMFFGDGWNITNNGILSKNSDDGTILIRMASNATVQSTLTNSANASIISSSGIGAMVLGYGGSYTNNLRIVNNGLISQPTASNTATYPGAIYIGDASRAISIFNSETGSIIGGNGSSNFHAAISNSGQIQTLRNAGLIQGNGPSAAGIIDINGSIGEFLNLGTISANGGISPVAVNLLSTNITRFENLSNGVIRSTGSSSSEALRLRGAQIKTLQNFGEISAGGNVITLDSTASISTFTNTGSIQTTGTNRYGIQNSGAITTLNNSQVYLTYQGNLPSNYNIKVNSPNSYGQLITTSPAGATNFGIYQTSKLSPNTVYTNVITGVTAANFTNGSVPVGRFGTGAMVTTIQWYLTNRGTNWDLVTQPSPTQSVDPVVPGGGTPVAQPVQSTNPVVQKSNSATSVANAIANSAVIASNGGADPTLKTGTSISTAVQTLTAFQVDELTNVHAEGYSSNMTIGLEQMKTVANTVMDRIHKPISNSSTTSTSYALDAGRYLWADVAGFNGTVKSYNGLAGFGYHSYYGVVGLDLFRNESGGLGLYAGAGNSSMNQSAQVSQTFNNNVGYVGLYGGMYLGDTVKLSGALGYSFGNTSAARNNPNIGDFTGGNATDKYSSNGAYVALKLSHSMLVGDSFTLTPFIGGSYSQLNTGAVNETGGGDFNYSINAAKSYQAITFAGAEFIQPLKQIGAGSLSLVGFYRFSYNWSANTDSAHTVTATSSAFGTFNQTGANMGPVSNIFGLGLQGQLAKDLSFRLGAIASINTNGTQYGGGGELRLRF